MRKLKQYALLFTAIFLFHLPVYAESPSDQLTQLLHQLHTFQADFTQKIVDQSARSTLQSSGKMYLMRPGKFRWEVRQPNKQLIITNNNKIWIYDPDLEQVTVRLLNKEAGEAPALLLSNSNQTLTKSFQVQRIKPGSELQWFSLVPKDKSSMFAVIQLGFLGNQIKQMQLKDHLGHTTYIRFAKTSANSTLSQTLFVFHPPANVDVIDETR